jgi:competence ComEA-like helix-hairpin-helix protein
VLPAFRTVARIVRSAFTRCWRALRPGPCFLIGLLLVMASSAFSQTGRITGTVRDQQQAAVAGANVVLRSPGTHATAAEARTSNEGLYVISSVAPSSYDLEVSAKGFRTSATQGLKVVAGQTNSLDFSLVLESVASDVSVEGTAQNGHRAKSATNVGSFGSSAQESNGVPDWPHKDLFENVCKGCHGLDVITAQRDTREGWTATVTTMRSRGAAGTDQDFQSIIDYLAKFLGTQPARLNVNTATTKEIESALGLESYESDAIVQYRKDHGDFKDWDSLTKVRGVDFKKLEAKKDQIIFDSSQNDTK